MCWIAYPPSTSTERWQALSKLLKCKINRGKRNYEKHFDRNCRDIETLLVGEQFIVVIYYNNRVWFKKKKINQFIKEKVPNKVDEDKKVICK